MNSCDSLHVWLLTQSRFIDMVSSLITRLRLNATLKLSFNRLSGG